MELAPVKHQIGRDIMEYLAAHEYARFRDMRPADVTTNLFTYHCKLLIKSELIDKVDARYILTAKGRAYVDRFSGVAAPRQSPKVIVMLLVQDGYGNILVKRQHRQPYMGMWTLPSAEMLIDDLSVTAAAERIACQQLDYEPVVLRHVGDCYITVGSHVQVAASPHGGGLLADGAVINLATEQKFIAETRTFVHVVRFETDDLVNSDKAQWVEPLALTRMGAAPGVEQLVARSFFGDDFFFEEFTVVFPRG